MPISRQSRGTRAVRTHLYRLRAMTGSGWFKPFRSAGTLLAGRTVRGVLTLGYVALAARALGVTDFGALMLIQTLALAFGQMLSVPSWQVILSYGTGPLVEKDLGTLHRILKHALMLDLLGGALAAAVAYELMIPAAELLDIPPPLHEAARLYGLAAALMALGMAPSGVARLLDRFDLLAVHSTVTPALRLAGSLWLFWTGAGLASFLFLWFATWLAGQLYIAAVAFRELARRGLLAGATLRLTGTLRPVRGIWRFSAYAYLNNALSLVQLRFGVLGVGWLLGPAAAGLFRIANQIAEVTVRPMIRLFLPALYPELSRLQAEGRYGEIRIMMARTIVTVAVLAAIILSVLALFGDTLLVLMAGGDFAAAHPLLIWLAAGGAVASTAMPVEALLLASGYPARAAIAKTIATGAYVGALVVFLEALGLTGAGVALLVYGLVLGTALAILLYRMRPALFAPPA